MAANKERDTEFFLNEDANEDEQDIEAVKYASESSNDGDSEDKGDPRLPDSFSSRQWPQSYKYESPLFVHFYFILNIVTTVPLLFVMLMKLSS